MISKDWEPIETAPDNTPIIVTGYKFGDPEKGRFYCEAIKYEIEGFGGDPEIVFQAQDDDGLIVEVGFLTNWIGVCA